MGDLQTNLERLRIGLVAPYEYTHSGGVTEHIHYLGLALRNMGHDVKIIAPCAEGAVIPDHVISAATQMITIPFAGTRPHISLSAKAFPRVKEILERVPFDVMHVHEPLMPTLPMAVLTHSKVVNVGTFHAYREVGRIYLYGTPVLNRFMEKLDGRVAVSTAARDYVASYFPGEYRVIPNGIDPQLYGRPDIEPIEAFCDGRPNILFVGRLENRKGFKYLLAAYELVKREIPDARLIVVGAYNRKDKEPYVKYCREHHVRDVRFIGFASAEDKPRYFRTATVYCAPNTGSESFGIILLEAMASGCPVVASSIEGFKDVLEDGKQGLLVKPGDAEGLAAALLRVLREPELAARMGQSGRQRAQLFSWSGVARRVLDYYRELIIRRREVQTDAE